LTKQIGSCILCLNKFSVKKESCVFSVIHTILEQSLVCCSYYKIKPPQFLGAVDKSFKQYRHSPGFRRRMTLISTSTLIGLISLLLIKDNSTRFMLYNLALGYKFGEFCNDIQRNHGKKFQNIL